MLCPPHTELASKMGKLVWERHKIKYYKVVCSKVDTCHSDQSRVRCFAGRSERLLGEGGSKLVLVNLRRRWRVVFPNDVATVVYVGHAP